MTLVRIGWRLTHKAPPLSEALAGWEKLVARATHSLFYVLLLALPLLGWAMVSASSHRFPLKLFSAIPWPLLPLPASKPLHEFFGEAHEYAAYIAIALIVLHVAGALKHYFINRDDVLSRMLPALKPPAK